jgi:hypothetical protein
MLLSCHQNAGQILDIKIAIGLFENVSQFKHLGTTVTNQNLIQNFLSSCLLTKNLKMRIYKSIILPVVLYGCETSSLTLRGQHRLKDVWEHGAEEDIWTEEG